MLGAWLPCLTRARALGEQRFQIAPRVRRLDLRHFLWCPGSDDRASTNSAFGPKVDDPVRRLDDVEVVLDHQHGVSAIDEAVQHFEQQPNILEVQPRRGFVEDVEGTSRIPLRELGRELHALRLASRESGRALTEMDISESHVVQRFELLTDARLVLEERQRILHREIQDFADVQGAKTDFERLAVIALPLAHLAGHVHVGKKMHLDLHESVALAGLATPPLHVEGESSGSVPADLGVGQLGEQLANRREEPGVGRGVRARRATDRTLVDVDALVDEIETADAIARARNDPRAIEMPGQRTVQDVLDERRLPRARNPSDRDEHPERDLDVETPEVALARAHAADRLPLAARASSWGNRHLALSR